ncbi:MAG TPA: hypothetical protein VF774_28970 [Pseudoduganella sp.]|jgi:hypothetical protein
MQGRHALVLLVATLLCAVCAWATAAMLAPASVLAFATLFTLC